MDNSKETVFQPIGESTMERILEVQEATKKKSSRSLENTVSEGADGFKEFLLIIDKLKRIGAELLYNVCYSVNSCFENLLWILEISSRWFPCPHQAQTRLIAWKI